MPAGLLTACCLVLKLLPSVFSARRASEAVAGLAEEVEREAEAPVASEQAEDEVTLEDHIGW